MLAYGAEASSARSRTCSASEWTSWSSRSYSFSISSLHRRLDQTGLSSADRFLRCVRGASRVAQAESEAERTGEGTQCIFLTFAAPPAITIPSPLAPETFDLLRRRLRPGHRRDAGASHPNIALGTGRVLESGPEGVNRPCAPDRKAQGWSRPAGRPRRPAADHGADGNAITSSPRTRSRHASLCTWPTAPSAPSLSCSARSRQRPPSDGWSDRHRASGRCFRGVPSPQEMVLGSPCSSREHVARRSSGMALRVCRPFAILAHCRRQEQLRTGGSGRRPEARRKSEGSSGMLTVGRRSAPERRLVDNLG
jgi:hypothetical protein